MRRFSHLRCLSLAILALCACAKVPPPPAPAPPVVPQEQLSRIVEHYWDERIALEDVIDPQTLADSLSVERRYLAQIAALPVEHLDAAARLNRDMFKRRRETVIEGFTYPSELLPLNPYGAPPVRLALLAAQAAQYPLRTAADYEEWLRRLEAAARWSRQAIVNMREGVRRGYTTPRTVVLRMLPQLQVLGTDSAMNIFYLPLRSMPDAIAGAERTRLSKALNDAVAGKLLPGLRALHDFTEREYLPRTRQTLGLSDLPLGQAWYAYRLRRATAPEYTPAEVHRLGLALVGRLKARQHDVETSAPVLPAMPIGDLLNAYEQLNSDVTTRLTALFTAVPDAPLEILATDISREPAAPLFYVHAAAASKRPAVLYVDTSYASAKPAVASFLQHALPGAHLQNSLQQAENLPRFRRFTVEPAFTAGWGLYAASLGEELGLLGEDWAKAQLEALQMRCAVSLVVDTGIHAQGWTRAQALDYLHAQLTLTETEAESLLDGYAAMPADALACGVGESRIQALRSRAQQSLGPRFDIKEFHMQMLNDGAMPLDLLDAKIKAWMESVR